MRQYHKIVHTYMHVKMTALSCLTQKKNSFIILLYIIFSYIERFFSSSLTILRYLLPVYEVHFFSEQTLNEVP